MTRMVARRGFTLIEVITALALTGTVAFLAYRIVGVAVDGVSQLARAQSALDRTENGRRWLRSALLSLEAGGNNAGFDGYPNRLAFSAWLQRPEGWFTRERISIQREGDALIADIAGGPRVAIADSVSELRIDYLLEPGADTKWVQQWLSPLSAPLAVRLRIGRSRNGISEVDTLLLVIKERG